MNLLTETTPRGDLARLDEAWAAESSFVFLRLRGTRVFNNCGCAEAMPRLTLRRAEAAVIGPPLPGVWLRAGEDGRLEFQSPYAAVALVTDSGLHPVDPGDWTPAGDLAEPRPGGSWRLLGREGDVFNRYGEKIALPDLLPAAAERHPGETSASAIPPARRAAFWCLRRRPTPPRAVPCRAYSATAFPAPTGPCASRPATHSPGLPTENSTCRR